MKNKKQKKAGGKAQERKAGGRPKAKPEKKTKPFSIKARELAESIITAIIFVLIIRQYAAETFNIPTQSMKPTLLGAIEQENGRNVAKRQGDHLIADKVYYKYHPVERFDIVLFKDPVDTIIDERYIEHKTLIKRIVGLPGDTLEIRHGDLYVSNDALDEEIPEKPRKVQEALWRNVFKMDFSNLSDFHKKWRLSGPAAVTEVKRNNGIEIDARKMARVDYSHNGPVDDTPPLPNPVGDLLLEVAVHPLDGGGAVELTIIEEGDKYTFRVPVEGGGKKASLKADLKPGRKIRDGMGELFESEKEGDVSLPIGVTTVLSLENADDRIIARVNGRETLRIYAPVEPDYRDDTEFDAKKSPNKAVLTLDGCHVSLERLRLARDVYYTDVLYIPPVKDRSILRTLVLRDEEGNLFLAEEKDGKLIRKDGRPLPRKYQFVAGIPIKPSMDFATGKPYKIGADEYFAMGDNSPGSLDSRSWGTLPKEYILGRAVILFWPFWPFSETFRPKIVR